MAKSTTTRNRTTRTTKTTAKKTGKKTSIGASAILLVVAGLVAFIAYRQIFLAGRITGNLPKEALTRSLEACVQENVSPSMLTSLNTQNQSNLSSSFIDLQGMLKNVLGNVSSSVVKARVTNNYINEVKVLNFEDLLGKNAQMRISGAVDIAFEVPVIGQMDGKKEYQTVLVKRDKEYYFNALSVKGEKEANWKEWSCAKTL
ncbi:MAG: hypothetical protein GY862_39600 [Gammaproteobacteria bacterium]|nr:hypothetical protein [Gammaproteobacteria bacterium]